MPAPARDPYPYRGQPSEARDILNALATAGMQRAAIAQALGVKARKLADINAGKTNGATVAARLRALYEASRVQFSEKLPALPVHSPVRPAPAPAPSAPAVDPSTVPLTAAVDAADLPPDERTTGERVRGKLRDFLLGKDGATAVIDAAERKQSGKAAASSDLESRQARFVEQIAPILGLVAMIAGYFLYPDPYRDCAPTQPEGEAMVRPILRIAARQLEIAGQLSENTVDLLASLAATAIYAQRSWATYREIKRGGDDERSERQNRAGRGDPAAPAARHFASQSTSADGGHQASGGQPGGAAGAAGDARNAENGEAPSGEQRRAAALLDGVLAADADGRRRLALN